MKSEINLKDLIQDARNFNQGTEEGRNTVKESLGKLGAARSIVIDKNDVIIAGNKTVDAALAIGLNNAIVVETQGDKLLVVKRIDLDMQKDDKARELAFADNRTSQLGLSWDTEELTAYLDSLPNPTDIVGVDLDFLNSLGLENNEAPLNSIDNDTMNNKKSCPQCGYTFD